MEWISVKDRLPKTEIEDGNINGSYYFSGKLKVRQGKREIRAWYKPISCKFYSVNSASEIVNVSHWKPIIV